MQLILFNPLIGPYQALPCWDSGPKSNGNEGVLCIPQSSSITETSPSDCLVSYTGHSLGRGLNPLQKCCQCILQPQLTGQEKSLTESKIGLVFMKEEEFFIVLVGHH